ITTATRGASSSSCAICALKNQDSSSAKKTDHAAPNFVLLDATLPDVAQLVTAMLQARDAVERRSWSHPQEPTGEAWWADVLADPRARTSPAAPIPAIRSPCSGACPANAADVVAESRRDCQ